MENSSHNGKQSEPTTATDQMQQPTKSESPPESKSSGEPVFIRRKKGMPFAEFKKICIESLEKAGLLQD